MFTCAVDFPSSGYTSAFGGSKQQYPLAAYTSYSFVVPGVANTQPFKYRGDCFV